jgi:asparagine synthetase B (glutamine-hydrolysing)
LFQGADIPDDETAYARQVLKRFMRRAYRRPPTPDEVEYVLRFHNKIRPDYPNFTEAIRQSLAMTLMSPQIV